MGRYAGHDRHPHLSWQATTISVLVGAAFIWLVVAAAMSLDARGTPAASHRTLADATALRLACEAATRQDTRP